jgi:hypothetical protein
MLIRMTNDTREQMHLHHDQAKRTKTAAALFALVLASLLLAACGSSSKGASGTTSATTARTGTNSSRFAALRECMQKAGVALPKRSGKQGRPPSGGAFPLGGGASGLPKGVTRSKFQAALRECGAGALRGRGGFAGGPSRRLSSPSFKKALAKFATCMRENGVHVPTPNTSGKGPIFDTNGLNVNSSAFKAAQKKCSSLLRVATPGGAGGGSPGAPPSGAGAPPAPAG